MIWGGGRFWVVVPAEALLTGLRLGGDPKIGFLGRFTLARARVKWGNRQFSGQFFEKMGQKMVKKRRFLTIFDEKSSKNGVFA